MRNTLGRKLNGVAALTAIIVCWFCFSVLTQSADAQPAQSADTGANMKQSGLDPSHKSGLVGTWKFLSYLRTDPQTGKNIEIMGASPKGHLIYTPQGRMMVIVVAADREPIKSDEDRIALHKRMVAYTGLYSVEGNQVVHHVDASWDPAWIGTDLVRRFKIDGDRLTITTAPTKYGNGNVEQVSTLSLQRVN